MYHCLKHMNTHTVPKIRNKYSHKCNCAASFQNPISTFMYV